MKVFDVMLSMEELCALDVLRRRFAVTLKQAAMDSVERAVVLQHATAVAVADGAGSMNVGMDEVGANERIIEAYREGETIWPASRAWPCKEDES